MIILRAKTHSVILFVVFCIVLLVLPDSILAQKPKFKNLKSINVGAKHDALVKVMFTTTKEEYFYAIYKNVKIKKINIYRIEAKIRKSDSVCVEMKLITNTATDATKLLKLASHDFGKPEFKVLKSATTYDWLWTEKKYPSYIESKSFHYTDSEKAEFKIILIPQ